MFRLPISRLNLLCRGWGQNYLIGVSLKNSQVKFSLRARGWGQNALLASRSAIDRLNFLVDVGGQKPPVVFRLPISRLNLSPVEGGAEYFIGVSPSDYFIISHNLCLLVLCWANPREPMGQPFSLTISLFFPKIDASLITDSTAEWLAAFLTSIATHCQEENDCETREEREMKLARGQARTI